MWYVILLLTGTCASGYTIIDYEDPREGVLWPTEYYLQGVKLALSVGLEETFQIWYSAELNRSRISYYDGMDSTYLYSETNETMGRMYKLSSAIRPTLEIVSSRVVENITPRNNQSVHLLRIPVYPKASEDLDIYDWCSQELFEGDAEDFLPSSYNFTYSGEIIYKNKTVRVWEEHTNDEDETEDHLLYVYKSDLNDFDVPVRYEKKKYNAWTQALTGHEIVEWYNFKIPDSSDLDIENVESCADANIGTDLKKALSFYHPDVSFGLNKAFHAYKHHHKRQYNEEEHEMRKRIFHQNWRQVIAHNKKNLSYKMEINHFSDRTPEELRYLTGTSPNPLGRGSLDFPHSEEELQTMVEDLPENFNMRLDGVISNVKNQGDCGSCWSFSTTAAVEGALARSNGDRNIDLSEQSLVDCAWGFFNFGCNGGLLDTALKYVLEYGIPSEREYGSYLAQDGRCAVRNMTKVYKIKGFARVPPLSVNAMKVALYKYGPVAIAIYASDALMKYSSGIFFDPECEDQRHINHGVTVVGYGVRDGTLYWIVKNSWGEEWGQDGYVLMSSTNDNCLALTEAYYPII